MSADGRYMLQGELVDVEKRVSLTEPRRRQVTRTVIDTLGEDKMIVFKPEKVKHVVTVFTDIDCGYCRKLHNEMDQYLEAGIEVRYMMFPRAGAGSESYKKAVAVWCAEDRNGAMTDAKNGKAIEMKSCDNPIDQHMDLVRQLGARGTPFIVLEDGSTQPGYVPAKRLSNLLSQVARQ
jgi:thiol:disulfide interchange protein DsbC